MTCEHAEQNMTLAQYGELPDELHFALEQHVDGCEDCRREWNALRALADDLSLSPMLEVSPNLLAASRMRLEEALDAMPPRSLGARFQANFFRWMGTLQGAPALMTLLIGAGFLGGTALTRYQVAHAPKLPTAVILSNTSQGAIASVTGIVQTPNTDVVQVKYNRMVPETIQGSLDDPQVRQLLMLGTKLATTNDVHMDSVSLLADECRIGHSCEVDAADGARVGIRSALLRSALYDKSPAVRMKALAGLQPYVAQDQQVRNTVLQALMHDNNAGVRTQAITLLEPVQADSSVRQALRTVSTQDDNPAIRTASFQVLQGSADIQ